MKHSPYFQAGFGIMVRLTFSLTLDLSCDLAPPPLGSRCRLDIPASRDHARRDDPAEANARIAGNEQQRPCLRLLPHVDGRTVSANACRGRPMDRPLPDLRPVDAKSPTRRPDAPGAAQERQCFSDVQACRCTRYPLSALWQGLDADQARPRDKGAKPHDRDALGDHHDHNAVSRPRYLHASAH